MPALSRVLTVFLSTGLSEYALILVRVAIASRTESYKDSGNEGCFVFHLEPLMGLEPTTCSLRMSCSTN